MRHGLFTQLVRTGATLLVLAGGLACRKKVDVPAPTAPAVVQEAVPVLPMPLAARVPGDAEWCLASAGFGARVTDLMATNAWKQLAESLMGSPRPPVEDFCVSAGPGTADALLQLHPVIETWRAMTLRHDVAGLIFGQQAGWKDAQALDAVILALERFEMPPLLAGLRGPEAHAWLQKVAEPLFTAPWFVDSPVSMVTTTHGEQISLTEADASVILTPEFRRGWIAAYAERHPGLDPAVKEKLARALEVLAGKTFVIAVGKGKDSAWIGIAHEKAQLHLADGPEDSLLARPELAFATAHAAKPLLGLCYWSADVARPWHDEQPSVSQLNALLEGWESLPPLQAVAQKLQAAVSGLVEAEMAWREREFANGAAAWWWKDGLHMESRGGSAGAELERLAKTSRHAALLDGEKVIIGLAGHGREDDAGWRYVERWAAMAHQAALAVAESGLLGPPENVTWARLLATAAPAVSETWESGHTLAHKALGTDGAFILDAGGLMPALPGLPPEGEKVPLPRLCLIHEVKNRPLVSTAWAGIETGLEHLLKSLTTASPVPLPAAQTLREKNLVSHFYPSPFASEDLLLCATLDDETLLLGTSRLQQQAFGRQLAARAPAAAKPGVFFRFDAGQFRAVLAAVAEVHSKNSSDPGLSRLIQMLEPFGDLRVHSWTQEGVVRCEASWTMQDLPPR